MENYRIRENRITTACLLAAGTGSRLYPFTESVPKCLTEVNGQPILQLLVDALLDNGFKRLVVVVGHLEHHIRSFLSKNGGGLTIEYITNPLFQTTNNIYSLWLAKEKNSRIFSSNRKRPYFRSLSAGRSSLSRQNCYFFSSTLDEWDPRIHELSE